MLYFIPAWYQQNNWCESEQYWYSRRIRTEYDDTVKHIQLFYRSKGYDFQVVLLSFAPNFRHFLHRQSVFHAPYWSCFDAIQEIRRKKMKVFSFRNLNWPSDIEFVYTPFAVLAYLHGEKYAQIEFGEDGNLIQVDIYNSDRIQRRNIYDDRGFVSSTIVYEDEKPFYQDYLTDAGVWKLRYFYIDNHIEVNKKCPTYLLEYQGKEYIRTFSKLSYEHIELVIFEIFTNYLSLIDDGALFCVAMHELNIKLIKSVLMDEKIILSFFGNRYDVSNCLQDINIIQSADYVITDSQENMKRVRGKLAEGTINIVDITPFDSRVDFGISQQLNVQKIMVPVDGIEDEKFEILIRKLGEYLLTNDNAQVHLFTRVAGYNRKKSLLEYTRRILRSAGMKEEWAAENGETIAENNIDIPDAVKVLFFVEQCVDELSVSKCIREQRIIVDMRNIVEVYLRIAGLSTGIPQIVYRKTQFVEHGKNGMILKDINKVVEAISYYLDNFVNWNKAMVYSYEIGKKYTTEVLMDKWKEVIDFVKQD